MKAIKTAIFLGGGASAAEGAPVQSELFRDYWKLVRQKPELVDPTMLRELEDYFGEVFGLEIRGAEPDAVLFPTFEEALGVLDLAVRRRETLKHYDLENISRDSNRIGFIRQYLVLLMAAVLDHPAGSSKALHRRLLENLRQEDALADTVFLTTNYDLLLDRALAALPGYEPDYGFSGLMAGKGRPANGRTVELYKVHGSLNWLFCPACNAVDVTLREAGAARLLTGSRHSHCEACHSVVQPVIVPPTFFKDLSNVFLGVVWHQAERRLQEAGKVIFCGYSFPDADLHVKYLFKRAQTNRTRTLKFSVVNGHPGKKPGRVEEERNRYRRFLGSEVDYTELSFEDFATDPLRLYR